MGEKKKSVNFPEDSAKLITATYDSNDPWYHEESVISAELMIQKYQESCEKHKVEPIEKLIQQLKEYDYTSEFRVMPILDLNDCQLDLMKCESLEEILKRLRFNTIDITHTSITEEGIVTLFELIEYYESCQILNISNNEKILARGWQACSRMIKKTQCLKALIARETCLKEEFLPFFTRTIKIGTHLSILNLERCNLNGRPISILANALRMNHSLQEIYLGENNFESGDAQHLGNLLANNSFLQLLDLSNNMIGDKGAQYICLSLAEKLQNQSPQSPDETNNKGLAVLVLWNNCISQHSGQYFAKLIEKYHELEILNVGHNILTDTWLKGLREPLKNNNGLLTLGLQSTKLTTVSATEMSLVFEKNTILERVDLRDNQINVNGLNDLYESLQHNTHILQIDLDQSPTFIENDDDKNEYIRLHKKIITQLEGRNEGEKCVVKPSRVAENLGICSRKISLTCEIKIPPPLSKKCLSSGRLRSPAPSPTPSPILSPMPSPGKSRFSVVKVATEIPTNNINITSEQVKPSRFSITPVRDIPKIILPCDDSSKIKVGFDISKEANNIAAACCANDESDDVDKEVETLLMKENIHSEKLETITEINPAYIDLSPTKPIHGILSKNSKYSGTFPPRTEPLRETSHLSDNSQVNKNNNESKSTLQNLFSLFQHPSLSLSSTASGFFAKTEEKVHSILPSFTSLGYDPFKHKTSKTLVEKHVDSLDLKASSPAPPTVHKSKTKRDEFWDFGEDN